MSPPIDSSTNTRIAAATDQQRYSGVVVSGLALVALLICAIIGGKNGVPQFRASLLASNEPAFSYFAQIAAVCFIAGVFGWTIVMVRPPRHFYYYIIAPFAIIGQWLSKPMRLGAFSRRYAVEWGLLGFAIMAWMTALIMSGDEGVFRPETVGLRLALATPVTSFAMAMVIQAAIVCRSQRLLTTVRVRPVVVEHSAVALSSATKPILELRERFASDIARLQLNHCAMWKTNTGEHVDSYLGADGLVHCELIWKRQPGIELTSRLADSRIIVSRSTLTAKGTTAQLGSSMANVQFTGIDDLAGLFRQHLEAIAATVEGEHVAVTKISATESADLMEVRSRALRQLAA